MEQFLWEFHNCPFGKSIYVVAMDNDKIIGTNCVIPIILSNSKNEEILTGKSEDTLVDPEYRGQNIFNNIYDFLFAQCQARGFKAIWGYTTAKKPFEKIGFLIPFDHKQGLIVNNVWDSYRYLASLNEKNGLKQKAQIFALSLFSKMKKISGYLSVQKPNLKIVRDQKITEQVNNLIKSSSKDNPDFFYILQNMEFQQWRIYDNPNYYKLHTFGFYDADDKLVALVILNSHPNKVAYIVQSSFDNSITQMEQVKILKYVVKNVFSSGISLIRNWHFDTNLVNSTEVEIYNKADFIYLKRGISFVWKELDSTHLNPNNFLLSRVSTQGIT